MTRRPIRRIVNYYIGKLAKRTTLSKYKRSNNVYGRNVGVKPDDKLNKPYRLACNLV